jgi:excisionase family DNA binding protein
MLEAAYLTRKEAAQKYRVSLPTIARWTKNGTVPHIKIGGRVLISAEAVAESLKVGKR